MAAEAADEGSRGVESKGQVKIDYIDAEAFGIGPGHELWPVAQSTVYKMMLLMPRHFKNGFIETLSQLAPVDLTDEEVFEVFKRRNKNKQRTYVCELTTGEVFATGTLLIEYKFIHKGGKVAHLEDFVVHSSFRGMGVGTIFLEAMEKVAIAEGCYKMILDCKSEVVDFYEKQGYIKYEQQMRKNLCPVV